MKKWVFNFNTSHTDGSKEMIDLLGGKGANLAEMCLLKLPVPPGFTLSTEACKNYFLFNTISDEIKNQCLSAITTIEKKSRKKFGQGKKPLLFSIRSGAKISMPGMMDTVLNLGLNDVSVLELSKATNNPCFAWDSYRRLIQMYGNVVMNIPSEILEKDLEEIKLNNQYHSDNELTESDLKILVQNLKKTIHKYAHISFPQDSYIQLWTAIEAVFCSWNAKRAIKYRELNQISDNLGTAVNVQAMVFGNTGETSATGVCFTRDPSTGKQYLFGEYLINAQGEDVVAGIRTPAPLNNPSKNAINKHLQTLETLLPESYYQLTKVYQILEKHYKDMQDIEFTIEENQLYILQTRVGKRTVQAALKIAIDLVDDKIITKNEALLRINPKDLNQILHPRVDPSLIKQSLTTGLPASPGAACGSIVFDSTTAVNWKKEGKKVILIRKETSPEDIEGMDASEAILTSHGGMTSHAAVVARGMGKPCITACSVFQVDENKKQVTINGKIFNQGDVLTIDGGLGEIYTGKLRTIKADPSGDFKTFMVWATKTKKLTVRVNADNETDCKTALNFGAEGIGLCRTEHMFFDVQRILAVREMIFATTVEERKLALEKILPYQKNDFIKLFWTMDGKPVNIRLLDPPLHEFLPQTDTELKELAQSLNTTFNDITYRRDLLKESNPMLGHRGCRLGISYPEIYNIQVKAIIEGALAVQKAGGHVLPEIMIPLIASEQELTLIKAAITQTIDSIFKEQQSFINYKIGTMIELPRACITADQIATSADFFSFGTNDLTQTTFGLSRDDAGKFLPSYLHKKVFQNNPFSSLDEEGVGFLVKYAVDQGKKSNPLLHSGICGEHGGDPASIHFCHKIGLDYISCSPYRLPIAILAAAQAALLEQ